MSALIEELKKIQRNIYLNRVRSQKELKPIEETTDEGSSQ